MRLTANVILLILALVAAIIGFVLAMEWFNSTPEGNDLFAVLFASLSFFFASLLVPPR